MDVGGEKAVNSCFFQPELERKETLLEIKKVLGVVFPGSRGFKFGVTSKISISMLPYRQVKCGRSS